MKQLINTILDYINNKVNPIDDNWYAEQQEDIIESNHIIKLIDKHLERLKRNPNNIEIETVRLKQLCVFIGQVENNGKTISKKVATSAYGITTTAKGLYQFVDGSVEPAINRTKKYIGELLFFKKLRVHKNMNLIDRDNQTLLFLGDILEKKGSDKYIKQVLNGEKIGYMNVYFKLHHTSKSNLSDRNITRIENLYNKTIKV